MPTGGSISYRSSKPSRVVTTAWLLYIQLWPSLRLRERQNQNKEKKAESKFFGPCTYCDVSQSCRASLQ